MPPRMGVHADPRRVIGGGIRGDEEGPAGLAEQGALLEGGGDAGEIRGDLNLSAMRMMIVGALNWAVEWYHPEDGPAEDIARDFVEMVLHGLVPRGAAPGGR